MIENQICMLPYDLIQSNTTTFLFKYDIVINRAVTLSMSPVEVISVQAPALLSQFSTVLASEMDFGGYAGPAGSLLFIGALILVLAPPLASKQQN